MGRKPAEVKCHSHHFLPSDSHHYLPCRQRTFSLATRTDEDLDHRTAVAAFFTGKLPSPRTPPPPRPHTIPFMFCPLTTCSPQVRKGELMEELLSELLMSPSH